jgi:DNA-binding PucR family transcriptional regulator
MGGSGPTGTGASVSDGGPHSWLYRIFLAGSEMFERPTLSDTFRIASSTVAAISACTVIATYTVEQGRLHRFSGEPDAKLDLLVEAAGYADGVVLSTDGAWRYALFLAGNSAQHGCLVVRSPSPASSEELFLLGALARPTGAALATSELLLRERRRTAELRKHSEAQADMNQAMSSTIQRLGARQRVRDSFATAVASGEGETAILEALRTLTGRPAVLQDSFGDERARAAPEDQRGPRAALRPDDTLPTTDRTAQEWCASAVRSNGQLLGFVGIFDANHTVTDDDRFALEYASTSLAVELSHRRNLAEIELRLGRDLAADLVSGADAEGSRIRAEALHYDLGQPQRVVLASWVLPSPKGIQTDAALRQALTALQVPALVSQHGDSQHRDSAMAVVADDRDWSGLYQQLAIAFGSPKGSIGVGGRCSVADLPTSFAQARRALRIRTESREPYGLSNHDDLGLLRILDSSDGGAEVESFVQEWLGVLLDHDRLHHSELVHTLSVHLDSGGNYDRTAAALIVHRSTVRYRLGRIGELTGHDLSDPDTRFHLHVATRASAAVHGGSL